VCLGLLEHPRLITGLDATGSRITIATALTGKAQPLTVVNFDAVHLSIVACLVLALAAPRRTWRARAKACLFTLSLVFAAMTAVAVAQIESATDTHARERLSLELHTARERVLLDWAVRKTSLLAVFVLPAALFLTTYVAARGSVPDAAAGRADDARASNRSRRPWRVVGAAAATAGCALLFTTARYRQAGDAVAGLRHVAALNPASALARVYLARGLEQAGRRDEALAVCREALAIDAAMPEAHFEAGTLLFASGSYEEAVGHFEAARIASPRDTAARHALARTLLMGGRLEEARSAYEGILRDEPEDAAVHKDLGITLLRLERRCEALPHLERSLTLDHAMGSDPVWIHRVAKLRAACGASGASPAPGDEPGPARRGGPQPPSVAAR
jgi:Flp pilus assembly protein TadD